MQRPRREHSALIRGDPTPAPFYSRTAVYFPPSVVGLFHPATPAVRWSSAYNEDHVWKEGWAGMLVTLATPLPGGRDIVQLAAKCQRASNRTLLSSPARRVTMRQREMAEPCF
jgi:hypothetical protein